MSTSRADTIARISREIEDTVMRHYPGGGLLGVIAPGREYGRMFIELPKAMQWKELNERVNWTGLTETEKDEVMSRVLSDVREKMPEEIYPATWFDGILISVDRDAKVYDLAEVRGQIETPTRGQNFDEIVCASDRIRIRDSAHRTQFQSRDSDRDLDR